MGSNNEMKCGNLNKPCNKTKNYTHRVFFNPEKAPRILQDKTNIIPPINKMNDFAVSMLKFISILKHEILNPSKINKYDIVTNDSE